MKKLICLIIALLFVPGFTVQANQFPPFPANEAVLDTQGVLSTNTVQELVSGNNQLFQSTGGEVLFYITDFLPMGYTASDFALELFNTWEVGSAENNNGVLMVIALATGDHHITVGGGLANRMSGGYLHEITHNYFIEHFDAGNYDVAVSSIFGVLSAEIQNMFATGAESNPAPVPVNQAQNPIHQNEPRGNNNWLIIVIVVVVLLLIMPRRRGFGGGMMGRGGMFGRRRMGGGGMLGGMLGGYMLGRARHRQPSVRQPRTQTPRIPRPPTGGGFTRGGSSGGFGGRSGGGFTRGGSSRGGGYGGRRR